MPFYRTEDGRGTLHVNFGRKRGPARCVAKRDPGDDPAIGAICGRMSVALCDHPAGNDLAGNPVTCDAPICERHRIKIGPDVDHCPRHTRAVSA